MSQDNRLNVLIPAGVIADVLDHLNQIQAALEPYVVALTDAERRSIAKMGDKTLAFVEKVATYVETNGNFVPSYMDTKELDIDVKNALALQPILKVAEQVCNNINDTAMVSGSEAYTASLMYYGNVRQADKDGAPNARQVYDDLSERFPGRPKKRVLPKEISAN